MNSKTLLAVYTIFAALSGGVLTGSTNNVVTAQEEADFKIKDFGIRDGTPWLTVEGKAGGSTPDNASQIYAYAFVTDNGTYAVTSHGVEDSAEVENDTQWHTHGVTLDDKNCVAKLDDSGNAEVGDEVKVTNVTATKVDKVMTAILSINNQDASVCVTKLIDSAP